MEFRKHEFRRFHGSLVCPFTVRFQSARESEHSARRCSRSSSGCRGTWAAQDFMPYRPEHRERTRMRIVRSAMILFNRHGFESVSIDDVMAHAGLTRGGFYPPFETKRP